MKSAELKIAGAELVRCHSLWLADMRRQWRFAGGKPFRVVVTPNGASSYEELRDRFLGKGELVIGSNNSEGTPYGVHGNLTIRAAHDLAHVLYDCDFSRKGELLLADRQADGLLRFCKPELRKHVEALYWLDTIGSQLHHYVHGNFTKLQQTTFLSKGCEFLGV